MIEVIVRNCDGIEIKKEFKGGAEFIKNMNGDGTDSLMLDDEIISLDINGKKITNMFYVNDLYNAFDEDYDDYKKSRFK